MGFPILLDSVYRLITAFVLIQQKWTKISQSWVASLSAYGTFPQGGINSTARSKEYYITGHSKIWTTSLEKSTRPNEPRLSRRTLPVVYKYQALSLGYSNIIMANMMQVLKSLLFIYLFIYLFISIFLPLFIQKNKVMVYND